LLFYKYFWKKRQKNGPRRKKIRQEGGDKKKRNKVETKRGIEKREFVAHNL